MSILPALFLDAGGSCRIRCRASRQRPSRRLSPRVRTAPVQGACWTASGCSMSFDGRDVGSSTFGACFLALWHDFSVVGGMFSCCIKHIFQCCGVDFPTVQDYNFRGLQCYFRFVSWKFPWGSDAVSVSCHENFHTGVMEFSPVCGKISSREQWNFLPCAMKFSPVSKFSSSRE